MDYPKSEQDAYRAFQSLIIGHGKLGRAFFVQQYLSFRRADPAFADGFYQDTASKLAAARARHHRGRSRPALARLAPSHSGFDWSSHAAR